MSNDDLERLCAGYRSTIEDPAHDAADTALLRAAHRRARRVPTPRLVYGIAASLLAVLGIAALLRSVTGWQRPPAAVLGTLSCGAAAAIDLNARGVLDRVRLSRPADYAKIMSIIAGLTRHPEMDVARWITVSFHARDVSYVPLWRTSLPPQRLLSLCLNNARYSMLLTLAPEGARVSPTGHHPDPRPSGR